MGPLTGHEQPAGWASPGAVCAFRSPRGAVFAWVLALPAFLPASLRASADAPGASGR
jgi:hypothetical protein